MQKNEDPKADSSQQARLAVEARIRVVLEEYRALYGLLNFRLGATDRRLPATSGALAALLGGTTAMPPETQIMFLIGLPVALVWLVFTTAQHLRSKEDHLRRIDEIERLVNSLAGEKLLVFQSQHPNRERYPGGRTGFAAMLSVLTASVTMLAGCAVVASFAGMLGSAEARYGYVAYLAVSVFAIFAGFVRLGRYGYEKRVMSHCPRPTHQVDA